MLPDFPAMRRILDDAARFRLHMKARSMSVIASLIPSITQHEGSLMSYHQVGTGTITHGYDELITPLQFPLEEIPSMVGEKLEAKLDALADVMAKQTSDLFYKKMDEITARTGNSIDLKGGPITQQIMLEMYELTDWSPSSVFIAHPVMAEEIGKKWQEWQTDAGFMKKFTEIDRRKKEEWRDRESNRKLVD